MRQVVAPPQKNLISVPCWAMWHWATGLRGSLRQWIVPLWEGDVDSDGVVSPCFLLPPCPSVGSSGLFSLFDVDGDDLLSDKDLMCVVRMMTGESLTNEEATAIVVQTLRDFDADGDGKLSFQEFSSVRPDHCAGMRNRCGIAAVVWRCACVPCSQYSWTCRCAGYGDVDTPNQHDAAVCNQHL